jgi:hypothetical protein
VRLEPLATPVALVIFNRPDTTARVVAEIARARPPRLLVIADGPRSSRPGEAEKCAQARAVIERVDWQCEVLFDYAESNLGCKGRLTSGIRWVFEQVPEAIFLEDDCVPHPTFFAFCEQLLHRYRDDQRVSQIGGANFQFGRNRTAASYYFSRYHHVWGWASWRRAWHSYDADLSLWPEIRDSGQLAAVIPDAAERAYWTKILGAVHSGKIDTWDYQWNLSSWAQGRVSIIPAVNLISNIGFGSEATHTQSKSIYAGMTMEAMQFPLQHPRAVLPDIHADAYTAGTMFSGSLGKRVLRKLRALWQRFA